MSGGNITMVVDNLEKRGLVKRVRETADRRYVTVHLTPEGRQLIERIFPAHVAAIVEEFSALHPEEQTELGRLCKKLRLRERTARGDGVAGPEGGSTREAPRPAGDRAGNRAHPD